MHPYFHIFGLSIKAYDAFLFLAAMVVVGGSYWLAKRRGERTRPVLVILSAMAAATLVGARALHVVTNLPAYDNDPRLIFNFSLQGQSIYGGFILAIVVGLLLSRIYKINIWRLGDVVAPFLGLGLVLVRIGCYLNGCCYGIPTDKPWGVHFPLFSPVHRQQMADNIGTLFSVQPVHPTELYEVAIGLFIAGVSFWLFNQAWLRKGERQKSKFPDGTVILVAGLIYSLFRFFIQPLRAPTLTQTAPESFYPFLYLSFIAFIFLCLFLIWRIKDRPGRASTDRNFSL